MIFFKKHRTRKTMVYANKVISEIALKLYDKRDVFDSNQITMFKRIRDHSVQIIELKLKLKSVEQEVSSQSKWLTKCLGTDKIEEIKSCLMDKIDDMLLIVETEHEYEIMTYLMKETKILYKVTKLLENMRVRLTKMNLQEN